MHKHKEHVQTLEAICSLKKSSCSCINLSSLLQDQIKILLNTCRKAYLLEILGGKLIKWYVIIRDNVLILYTCAVTPS